MATPNLFVFFALFFSPIFIANSSQKSHHQLQTQDAISSLKIELDQLKTKLSVLESTIEKGNHELQSKDEDNTQMKNVFQDESQSIASLQNKIETLQLQNQKTELHKTEQAREVAEEEIMKSEPEATFMKSVKDYRRWLPHWLVDNLNHSQDYRRWLPHWLVDNLNHSQSLVISHWKTWRPALDASFPKIMEKLSHVRRDSGMCIQTVKREWIVMKDQWLNFISSFGPHFESLTAKTIEAYHASKNSLLSSTIMIQKAAAPVILEAHKFSKPYINQIAIVTKPYINSAVATLKPYSRKPDFVQRMLTSAITYHKQVQQFLKTNELTRSLASMELAWFAATASLCLPVVFLCKSISAIFRTKTRKFRRISHSNRSRRKLKRPHDIE